MAVGVRCPHCGRIGYTSSPQTNSICPYCGQEHHPPPGERSQDKRKTHHPDARKKEVEKKGEKYNL